VPPIFDPLLASFLDWARVERGFSAETISTYERSIRRFITEARVGSVEQIAPQHVAKVKRSLMDRGCSNAYVAIIILSVRAFLFYCRDVACLTVMNPNDIKPPKRPRRQVKFLSLNEVQRFVQSIQLERRWLGNRRVRMTSGKGLLHRALVEALLGSGMRISEALSLRREAVDFVKQEARVVGKGGKERTVFFTNRAVHWLREYLAVRKDGRSEMFVTESGRLPLNRHMVIRWFGRQSRRAGLNKSVTAHMLRHTVATTLMFNGCPLGHIKEILGHERLDTTCRYYLGLDQRQAKKAFLTSLCYDEPDSCGAQAA
jgi:integrase/recombinase XerD